MRRELLEILACPVCRLHFLKLYTSKIVENEVVSGTLACPRCELEYCIDDGIPDLVVDLSGWYVGMGSPEAFDKHYDTWGPKSQRQAEHPWPYKIVIAKKAKGLTLDVGCGYGCTARFIERGVFLDFSLVALKKRWVGGNHPRVRANAERMPFGDSSFGTVIATELIEHTDNPHRFVEEVHRVLKEGGQFLLSFPWSDDSATHHFKMITKEMVHGWISPLFTEYEYDVPPQRKERGMVYAHKRGGKL